MEILHELKQLISKLNQSGIDYALCGGLAVAIYAKPRSTLDIDLMIEPGNISEAEKAIHELGFSIQGEPMEFKNGAVIIYRYVKVDKDTGEHLVLDILLATRQLKKAWKTRIMIEWEAGPLTVVSPQGLIFLKSFRNSGQDKDDIDYLRSIEDEA